MSMNPLALLTELEAADQFVSRHIGPSETEIAAMLRVIGRATLDDGSIHLSVTVERYVPQDAKPAAAAPPSSPAPADAPAPEQPSVPSTEARR